MKHAKHSKKILAILSLALSASTLFACTGNQTVSFTQYWAKNPNNLEQNISQKLEYSVTFEKNTSTMPYSVDYQNGKYVTELSMVANEASASPVYCYKTSLAIDVVYEYKGESKIFSDFIQTEVLFHTTKNFLKPISSKKSLSTTSPNNTRAISALKDCYTPYEYEVETSYNENCTKGTSVVTKKDGQPHTENFSVSDKYTYLDNEQLLFAISGITPSDNSSPRFSVYAPFTDAVQTIAVTFNTIKTDSMTFIKNGEEKEYDFSYFPVSIKINAQNSGATQTAWYASYNKSPELRNAMLKLEVPVSYNLGTLTYLLTSATFSE